MCFQVYSHMAEFLINSQNSVKKDNFTLTFLNVKKPRKRSVFKVFTGSWSPARTDDPAVNSRMLCQLSYSGIWPNFASCFCALCTIRQLSLISIFRVALLTLALPTELFRNIWKIRNLFRILQFRQLSIFPGSRPPSIFNVKELNFRVRYGYGWFLFAIVTGFFRVIPSKLNNATSSYDSLPLLFSLS